MILLFVPCAKKLHGSEIDAYGQVGPSKMLLRDGTHCPSVLLSLETEVIPFGSGPTISPLKTCSVGHHLVVVTYNREAPRGGHDPRDHQISTW